MQSIRPDDQIEFFIRIVGEPSSHRSPARIDPHDRLSEPGFDLRTRTKDGRREVPSSETEVAILYQGPKGVHVQAGGGSAGLTQQPQLLDRVALLKQRRHKSHSFATS